MRELNRHAGARTVHFSKHCLMLRGLPKILPLAALCAGLALGQQPDSSQPLTGSRPHPASDPAAERSRALGSVYVPLDSWIYPALDRLAALGYVPDHVSNIGPITRAECRKQTEQAEQLASNEAPGQVLSLISDLKAGCADPAGKAAAVRLESMYFRGQIIGGNPLRDSYHFGQTVFNDFGRPYGAGFNQVTGFSTYAAAGPVFAYYRGEYQRAPGGDAYTPAVQQFIARVDGVPVQGTVPSAPVSRAQALEAYAGVRLGFETVTFGRQDFWWGPGANSAFSFSTNAEPFYSVRLSQTTPLILPGPFARLGRIRTEIVFGKLSGHSWPPRPYINAEKVSLDITRNFEVGFSRSAIFGGVGHPLTAAAVASSIFSVNGAGFWGSAPGDRHAGFDFRYRLPGLRRYVTVYSDSFADDDVSPLANPKRSAWAPGLYIAQVPGARHFDFRLETYSTWLYRQDEGGDFLYYNMDYRDSYTNKGYLLGSWAGRDARAYVASSTFWLSGRSKVEATYRQIKTGNNFLPGGGTQSDGIVTAQWGLNSEWLIIATAQYERYFLPVLGPARQTVLGSFQLVFSPQKPGL